MGNKPTDSLNQQNEPRCKRFNQKKIEEFQSIYFNCYGTTITDQEAENNLIEITQLLEEVIRINYEKNHE